MHTLLHRVIVVALTALASLRLVAQDPSVDSPSKPITTVQGKVGDLLRQWWKEGTAAGNAGDWYDNRDGAHSDLNTQPFPQLQRVVYTDEDIKLRRHWAAQRVLLPKVVFGNSSTSAPPTAGGSNPRQYYVSPAGLAFLHEQYRNNNLYIYPEHRDHDPGHNGRGDGFGDLYPTNTPYLIISQGSSGSDQPFMRALPLTLAAFRPEVKMKLTEARLLMPTIQWLLRRTNKNLKDPKEYLTGKAHPTVFEGSWVDELALVQKAHALTLDALPPLVQLKVIEEDRPQPGRDYFDPAPTEKLADTPSVIARVFRGKDQKRRLVVSAADSFDVNKQTLTFAWVVLRGAADKVRITPRNQDGSEVEIIIPYHARVPIAPGSPMESNRVEIGVFAYNGTHYSSPAFITSYSLDNEHRVYDAGGNIREIRYGYGDVVLTVTQWPRMLELLGGDTPAAKVLGITKEHQSICQAKQAEHQTLAAALAKATQTVKEHADRVNAASSARKRAEEQLKKADDDKERERLLAEKSRLDAELASLQKQATEPAKALQNAAQAVREFLEQKPSVGGMPLAAFVEQRVRATIQDDKLIDTLRAAGTADLDKVLKSKSALLHRGRDMHHAAVLSETVLAGALGVSFQTNFVDQRLTLPKDWRDEYRYDAENRLLGWTRHDGDKATDFSRDGLLVLEKDNLGRCLKGRTVHYFQEPSTTKGFNPNPLRFRAGDTIVTMKYANDEDTEGVVATREKAAD